MSAYQSSLGRVNLKALPCTELVMELSLLGAARYAAVPLCSSFPGSVGVGVGTVGGVRQWPKHRDALKNSIYVHA